MKCAICEKSSEETPLFRGLDGNDIIAVCLECSRREGITLIQKPTKEQLAAAERRDTVRETMERLSGNYIKRPIANLDHSIPEKSMEKIRVPLKGTSQGELVNNYYWEIKMARRRKKMTIQDLSKVTGVSRETLDKIEQGFLPKNYGEYITKIEKALQISLMKDMPSSKVRFNFPKQETQKIGIDVEKIKEERQRELNRRREIQEKTTLSPERYDELMRLREQMEKRQPEIPKTRVQLAMEKLHQHDKARRFESKDSVKKEKTTSNHEMMGDEIEFEE